MPEDEMQQMLDVSLPGCTVVHTTTCWCLWDEFLESACACAGWLRWLFALC